MSTDELSVPAGYAANLFDLKGRVAVVTGGGSGLGAAMSIGLAQVGVEVVVADVNLPGAEATHATITEQNGKSVAALLDVTSRTAVVALADKVERDFGRVDILINSAGSAFRSPAEDFPEDKLDFILNLNLKGTYLCCQAFGQKMLSSRQRQHYQRRVDRLLHCLSMGQRLPRFEGRRAPADQSPGAGMADPRRARQRHWPDFDGLAAGASRGAEKLCDLRLHQGAHDSAAPRLASRTDWDRNLPGERRVGACYRPHRNV